MVQRKKPSGDEWEALVVNYYSTDHGGKLELAKRHGITYDSLKHWLSEGRTDQPLVVTELPQEPDIVQEILSLKASTELDFVMFDLETTNFKADFSVVLCGCIKPYGEPTQVFRFDDYKEWETERANDYHIVKDIAEELSKHAVVVTHYGTGFDIRYLRAKLTAYGLPDVPTMFHVDTYSIAKQNFLVSSRRLEALARYFKLGEKSRVDGQLWMDAAMNGSKEAMDAIVQHNIVDCEVLEKLACVSFRYLKSMRKV